MRSGTAAVSSFALLVANFGVVSSAAPPKTASGAYPEPIRKKVAELASMCREITGSPGRAGDTVRSLDANADGIQDYLLFTGDYECPGALSLFAPTAASGVETVLYLQRAGGRMETVWTGDSWGPELAHQGKRIALMLRQSGGPCGDGRGDAVSVAERYACTLQLRPNASGKWELHELVNGKPVFAGQPVPLPAAKPATDVASAKAYVESIYQRLPGLFNWRTDVRYAPDLAALLKTEAVQSAGGAGLLDAAPFCACQDTAPGYRFSVTVKETGAGKATAFVTLVNGGRRQFEIDLVRLASGWAVSDLRSAVWPSGLRGFLQSNLARPGARAVPSTGLPASVVFSGRNQTPSGYGTEETVAMTNAGGRLSGRIQDPFGSIPFTGTYSAGQCEIMVSRDRYVGPCDARQFSGAVFKGKKQVSSFSFRASGETPAAALAQMTQPRRALPAPVPAAVSSGFTPDGATGVENGWFDYVEGQDLPPEEQHPRASEIPQTQDGFGGLPAPEGTVWNYGRARWVVQPGRACPERQRLWKGYCFGAVMAHMQRNPKETSIVAITLSHRVPIGTWISNETPVRYNYIKVTRNGETFKANEERHGRAVVRIPPGCHFSPLKEGFVLTGPGPRGLTEAALFRCP